MGAGASSVQEVDLGVTTLVLGQALAAITFPDMFRLQDFHSPRAPKLRRIITITWFGGIQAVEDEAHEDEEQDPPPEQYQHMFRVQLGDQAIYIEDLLQPNALGWTPLHACCHSANTMNVAFKIIEEVQRRSGSFELKTLRGPGIFNAGLTALHMATAYGLEPVVVRLLRAGADPNCRNSYGFAPLFEASHRGFLGIARHLVEAKADLNALPTEEETDNCPLLSAPPQTPLGEAARFGFTPIVQLLLEAGANKDFQNSAGWTPLHEAAFYNHAHSVQLLLVHGADAAIKCNQGLVPWQLARSQAVKDLIAEMGGADAVPRQEADAARTAATSLSSPHRPAPSAAAAAGMTEEASVPEALPTPKKTNDDDISQRSERPPPLPQQQQPQQEQLKQQQTFSLLGDLPALQPRRGAQEPSVDVQRILAGQAEPKTLSPSKARAQLGNASLLPKDVPQEFICALTKQPICDPVRSTYGQVFEKEMILAWIQQHGHICPVTAMPLAESDLKPDEALRDRILAWKMGKNEAAAPSGSSQPAAASSANPADEDDLYKF